MTTPKAPAGLADRGRRLWREMHALPGFTPTPAERVLLEEACRITDRLEQLDRLLRGDVDTWTKLVFDARAEDYQVKVDGALAEARQQQNVLKQVVASLRIPDEAGKRPAKHTARGAYQPKGAGTVSSLERARQASGS